MPEYSAIYEDAIDRIQASYDTCSVAEQKMMRQILEEMAATGYSYTLEQIWLSDFVAIPVGIDQFLNDPYYLGGTNDLGNAVYPFWRQTIHNIFDAGNRYNEIIFSGATRIGKSSTSTTIMAYMLYRLMLYRDPHKYFRKKAVSKFTLGFANLTKELALGVGYREFNDTLKEVPWFMDHGSVTRSDRNFFYLPQGDKIEIIAASDSAQLLGKQAWAIFIDEMNFAKSGIKDINVAKQHMKGIYDTVNARISGTFRIGGEVYGKLIAASSKNQDNDFLSDHIEKQQRAGNEHLYLVDEPQWKILPKSMFSDEVFHFTVGDRYKKGFVIPEEIDDEAHRSEYEKQGYQVIEAPAELRRNFLADYDISLRDIAGISVAGAMGFITQESITPCVAQDRVNPFYEDILVIGKDDDLQIADFFHLEAVPQELKYPQLNIHLDLAESHNRTGIVGCCVAGNKVIETDEGKKVAVPFIKEVFAVAIEAPRGGKMSFQKVVNFIVWLRQNHFNVGSVTADKYQSSYLIQVLEQQGFDSKGLSPGMNEFIGLRNMIVDQRIELIRCPLQENELIATQRMNNKIYHPEDEGGGHGDIAEALCLEGNTKVFTLDGRNHTIEEMYRSFDKIQYYVLSYDVANDCIVPNVVKDIVYNGVKDNLVRLYLDTGESLVCTHDHKLLTRDGSYIEAKDSLHKSLMPFVALSKFAYSKTTPFRLGAPLYNHRVVKIEKVDPSKVYDIKLDSIHNFALTCGIFVHNCGSSNSLVAEQVTARPPARNLAAITAAVNKGTAKRVNPMSSSATIPGPRKISSSRPVHFPKLR